METQNLLKENHKLLECSWCEEEKPHRVVFAFAEMSTDECACNECGQFRFHKYGEQ